MCIRDREIKRLSKVPETFEQLRQAIVTSFEILKGSQFQILHITADQREDLINSDETFLKVKNLGLPQIRLIIINAKDFEESVEQAVPLVQKEEARPEKDVKALVIEDDGPSEIKDCLLYTSPSPRDS
eukprot:TRINITY_DN3070_c0_g2_i1.p1 TRINITY_DN3070_c0_g2~~TRINITY_DN3070_c0_g2_i1.p1  ORF type:complete len:128 (+),score=31.46 TRINITY_DN3070_c0_g2_i1:66-449(+)